MSLEQAKILMYYCYPMTLLGLHTLALFCLCLLYDMQQKRSVGKEVLAQKQLVPRLLRLTNLLREVSSLKMKLINILNLLCHVSFLFCSCKCTHLNNVYKTEQIWPNFRNFLIAIKKQTNKQK